MLSTLTTYWRATRIGALAILGFAITASLMTSSSTWSRSYEIGFTLIGSAFVFGIAYGWSFFVGLANIAFSKNRSSNHWQVKFFLWGGLIALPLVIADSLASQPNSDLAFVVAFSTGLISGCCHFLAKRKRANEQK